ncbi:MAG: hypothetical protein IJ538_02715 [Clostridia bacterium]|nr:hypothetical protein [Clostridia bacterium]
MKNFKKIVKKSMKQTKFKIDLNTVKNIEVAFLDFKGNSREIIIPKNNLISAITNGLKCDGNSIGESLISNSDMTIICNNSSIYPLPNNNLFVVAHTNFKFDPRKALKKIEHSLEKQNLKINIGVELEFFITNNNTLDDLSYFEVEYSDEFECLNEIMTFCEKVNFPIESFHHECGHGQFEINFKFSNPCTTADNIFYLKKVIKFFTDKHGLSVSFLPRPFENECGSGMHTNISIFKSNKNLFFDALDKFNLSKFAYEFANGIMNHIGAICYIANPLTNSYERLKHGTETPKNINIGVADRTSLIRIPIGNNKSTRLEFRLPDVSANPYLLFCAILLSGFDKFTKKQTKKQIPTSLEEAKIYLKNDPLISKLFPKIF